MYVTLLMTTESTNIIKNEEYVLITRNISDTNMTHHIVLRVSKVLGENMMACGTTHNPCRTIGYAQRPQYYIMDFTLDKMFKLFLLSRYAIATAPVRATILIAAALNERKKRSLPPSQHIQKRDVSSLGVDSDNVNILDKLYWITRSVIIKALDPDIIPVLRIDIIIAKTTSTSSDIEIKFLNIAFSGTMYIGDAKVVFENCTLIDCRIEQEYQRRMASDSIDLEFINCLLQNSSIVTAPPDRTDSNELLASSSLIIHQTLFEDSLVNITCDYIKVSMKEVAFRGFSDTTLSVNRSTTIAEDPVGMYFYTGVKHSLTPEENVTSTIRVDDSEFSRLYQVRISGTHS